MHYSYANILFQSHQTLILLLLYGFKEDVMKYMEFSALQNVLFVCNIYIYIYIPCVGVFLEQSHCKLLYATVVSKVKNTKSLKIVLLVIYGS